MNERNHNIIIGLTFLVGIVMLCGLLLAFAGLPQAFRTGYDLRMQFDSTHDIIAGDSVYLHGKRVGVVNSVEFTDDDPLKGVTITATVNDDVRLPTNIVAKVYTKALVGKGYLSLVPEGPITGKRFYSLDETITLKGVHDSGGLIPREVTDALKSFGKLADNLNELMAPQPTTGPATTAPADPPPGLQGTVARLNRTLDALYAVAGDEANRKNIKTTLANFAEASKRTAEALDAMKAFLARGEKTLDNADELTRQLITDAEQISQLLNELQLTVRSINQGEGTMGKLISDPQLYVNLIGVTERLNRLLQDFQQLTEQWKRQGVNIRLK